MSRESLQSRGVLFVVVFFPAEDGIRDDLVTGVQTCALPIFLKGYAGFQRSTGLRAAATSSNRETRVEWGASSTIFGSSSTSSAIERMASMKRSSSSRSEERRVGKEGRWRWRRGAFGDEGGTW